jgi:flagellar biosynthesis/type III secretory pathway chaperone
MTQELEDGEETNSLYNKAELKILEKEFNNLLKYMNANIDLLANLLKKENKFLEQGQVPSIVNLLEKKKELLIKIGDIQMSIKSFLSKHMINRDEKLVEQVKANYQNLQNLMQNNEILLQSNIEVSKKMVEIYQNQKTKEAIEQSGYDNSGEISILKRLEKIMPAISLNNKI